METKHLKSTHFSDYIEPYHVVLNLMAKNKVVALEELLDILEKQKLIENKKPMTKGISFFC